jgi:hypothetical protein
VQQLRSLNFERARTEDEEKREDLKTIHDAANVWDRGYGNGDQLTWLYSRDRAETHSSGSGHERGLSGS